MIRGLSGLRWWFAVLLLALVLLPGACTCTQGEPVPDRELLACLPRHAVRASVLPAASGVETAAAGGLSGVFSVTSTGEASYVLPLAVPPGRAGMEPRLALGYDSGAGDGVLGYGFSMSGASSITRCPKRLVPDGEIRSVRYDGEDKLCLDGQPLVVVGAEQDTIEYRAVPDSFAKVIGHEVQEGTPRWFEVTAPNGVVTEYGTSGATRPRGPGGAVRAWLSAKARDGRGNAIHYGYCFAEAEDHTAEYALDEIRYSAFEGSPALEAHRAVKLVYAVRDPEDVRTSYSGGMTLQQSLRLDGIEMVGPGEELVWRYAMSYARSAVTGRTLLTQVEQCAADGVCLPPTRFDYRSGEVGFVNRMTSIPSPTARRASPMLLDIDGDGLHDLVVPDTDPGLSTPQNPITRWRVAHNGGASASPPGLAPFTPAFSQEDVFGEPSGPADPALIQPELGTVLDYDQDGRQDVLLHDVHDDHPSWRVLLARPDRTFELFDTGIARPFPLGGTSRGSFHLADVDGNRAPDLIQCDDHGNSIGGDPGKPVWSVFLWRPAAQGAPFGFDSDSEAIEALAGVRCDIELSTVDLDGDGKVSLVVPGVQPGADRSELPGATYDAFTRREDRPWEMEDTELPVVGPGGRVKFLDVNGDGLPDAVQSGFQNGALYTYLNTGAGFRSVPVPSLGWTPVAQDTFFRLAATLDANGDGRQDLLMPVSPGVLAEGSLAVPSWALLLANGGVEAEGTFTLRSAGIPFEPLLGEAVTLADPHGPRVGDLNGDGAADVLLPLQGVFHVFENRAAGLDVLAAVTDGNNAHDPGEPGHVPNVAIEYGPLIDGAITAGAGSGGSGGLAPSEALYLSRSDPTNDCAYPRRCAVGSRRVVRSYALNDGAGGVRRSSVQYRDGRYHALEGAFLGFGAKITTDLDTGAGTADFHDNRTYDEERGAHPFARRSFRRWRYNPGLPGQPEPEKVELSFLDVTREVVATAGGRSYFTLARHSRVRRAQGKYQPDSASPTLLDYAANVAAGGGGATVLRDTTAQVLDFDAFGNVLEEEVSTAGVDLAYRVERTFKNDTARWVLGQLQTQKECSTAAMKAQCRLLARTTTIHGEVETEATSTDDDSPETRLDVVYERNDFGNVTRVTADDQFGHHRVSRTIYDAEGLFPEQHINAAGHVSLARFDRRLGVLTHWTDPNGLVTSWKHDGFGRAGVEVRPDGTTTTVLLSRTKDGGPDKDAYRVRQRTTTTGGADDEIELDSLGRPVRLWWHGPRPSGTVPRVMQALGYDPLTGNVARRSVPVSEGTAEGELLFDEFEYDSLGREVRRTTPWKAVTTTSYDGLFVEVTDPLGAVTIAESDPLGRLVQVTDAEKGLTSYTYGPFGGLSTVVDPGGALTRTTRDALGRVKKEEDPDRGTTLLAYDGFGELLSSTDALARKVTFDRDALGRIEKRTDQDSTGLHTTTWRWDTAVHGIGKLHTLESPDGTKTYAYTPLGQLERLTLDVEGESESLVGKIGYDTLGRLKTITYPTPDGAAPFVVGHEHDAYGHVLEVRNAATDLPYWHLTDVDEAGRFRAELLGNGAVSERSYFADKQRLKSLVTEIDGSRIQDLRYAWDARLALHSRTDHLQPQHPTERFRYDGLERLTCSYFSVEEDVSAPCAWSYEYAPNGNLTFKSDVGPLAYGDAAHPHAATTADGGSYGYDAVGNQTLRPGGVTVDYTPFDLPRKITEGGAVTTFGYDGDQERIRKTTPEEETLYFGDLYERVTAMVTGQTAHRYYIRSPERVVAIVTRGEPKPGTQYILADHLGSVDVVTDAAGAVVERRSYDAFGQRRNPEWGAPPPVSFAASTTLGFTGHESDHELGLVNMKGRVFDPRLGRFLTTDPLIADLTSGQAFNPYSYVGNSPLAHVDPSGFQGEPEKQPILPTEVRVVTSPDGSVDVRLKYPPREPPPPGDKDEDEDFTFQVLPIDMDTTGSASERPAAPPEAEPRSWKEHRVPQLVSGFLGGLALGLVPFAGSVEQALEQGEVIDPGTPSAQEGMAIGLIVGGFFTMVEGVAAGTGGIAVTATGVGAPVGVPLIVAATAAAAGGAANAVAGLQSLMAGPKRGAAPPAGGGAAPSNAQPPRKGGESAAAARGRAVHEDFKKKVQARPGWEPQPRMRDPATGKTVIPDALTPDGHPIELKPNTPSGRAAGKVQMRKYERAAEKKGRVIYYEP